MDAALIKTTLATPVEPSGPKAAVGKRNIANMEGGTDALPSTDVTITPHPTKLGFSSSSGVFFTLPVEVWTGDHVTFDELCHKYRANGKDADISVTGVIKNLLGNVFDADKTAKGIVESLRAKLRSGKALSASQQSIPVAFYGQDAKMVEFLLQQWNRIRENGTKFHASVEDSVCTELLKHNPSWATMALNGMNQTMQATIRSFFTSVLADGWVPVAPELKVFLEFENGKRLAGTMDMLFYHEQDKMWYVVDWKFTQSGISGWSFNKYGSAAYECQKVPSSKLHTYSLQLIIYKELLCAAKGLTPDCVKTDIFWVNPKTGRGKKIEVLPLDSVAQRGLIKFFVAS